MSAAEDHGVLPKLIRKEPSTKSAHIPEDGRRQRYVVRVYAVTAYRKAKETREECDARIAKMLELGSGNSITMSVYNHETGQMEQLEIKK